MHFVFGDGKVAVSKSCTGKEDVLDLIILDPTKGGGEVGRPLEPGGRMELVFDLNSAVLQFKNSASVKVLISQLQEVQASIEAAENSGWVAPDPWEVYLTRDPLPGE